MILTSKQGVVIFMTGSYKRIGRDSKHEIAGHYEESHDSGYVGFK